MENFGNKYLVKSNNIIEVVHRLHYLSYRSDFGLNVGEGCS